jgi:hypothetical protein
MHGIVYTPKLDCLLCMRASHITCLCVLRHLACRNSHEFEAGNTVAHWSTGGVGYCGCSPVLLGDVLFAIQNGTPPAVSPDCRMHPSAPGHSRPAFSKGGLITVYRGAMLISGRGKSADPRPRTAVAETWWSNFGGREG